MDTIGVAVGVAAGEAVASGGRSSGVLLLPYMPDTVSGSLSMNRAQVLGPRVYTLGPRVYTLTCCLGHVLGFGRT